MISLFFIKDNFADDKIYYSQNSESGSENGSEEISSIDSINKSECFIELQPSELDFEEGVNFEVIRSEDKKFSIKFLFDNPDSLSEGLIAVKMGGEYGFIDSSGKIIIKPQFEYAGSFSDGLAYVKMNDKYGYINQIYFY